MFRALVVFGCLALSLAAPQQRQFQQPNTTPVPILKQISNVNDDGSYTYGYEAADGSFKLETRKPNGEVFGKYGYVDANGEVRVIEYGANQLGFQPSGKGITVAPPTLVDESKNFDYDYVDPAPEQVPARPVPVRPAAPVRVAAPTVTAKPIAAAEFQSRFADFDARIARLFGSGAPQVRAPARTPARSLPRASPLPAPPRRLPSTSSTASLFRGHPARHIDLNTGSYQLDFVGRR